VLSHDAACFSRMTPPSWRANHAPHWHYENISRRVLPMLTAGGATDADIRQMLTANPARLLSPAEPTRHPAR
jgi:phosphotriesterase-related protein